MARHIHAACGHRCPCEVSEAALCWLCFRRASALSLERLMDLRVVYPILGNQRRLVVAGLIAEEEGQG